MRKQLNIRLDVEVKIDVAKCLFALAAIVTLLI